jgi:hypothetical protein
MAYSSKAETGLHGGGRFEIPLTACLMDWYVGGLCVNQVAPCPDRVRSILVRPCNVGSFCAGWRPPNESIGTGTEAWSYET